MRSQESEQKWQWVPSDKFSWVPGKFLEFKNGTLSYQLADGSVVKVPEKSRGLIFDLDRFLLLHTTHDLMSIAEGRNEPYVMYLLASRYYKGKIYTRLANRVLLSINPYRALPIYSDEIVERYKKEDNLPPHIFGLAREALDSLTTKGKSQSIVIIGESGSGKTEACKHYIKYIANACKMQETNIIDMVMTSFPLLEALGNAKTAKNNNSSRYGKWMEMFFDENAQIRGCTVMSYLLEKSRVATQNRGERNYHIFYYMCRGSKGKEREELFLEDIDDYCYLNATGCTTVDTIDDKEMYKDVTKGLIDLFGKEGKREILEILSAILLFGNVKIEPVPENESSKVSNVDLVEKIGKLLRIDPKRICDALTMLKTENFVRPYTAAKAVDARNACAKTLYAKLFNYVIAGINKKFQEHQSISPENKLIGILDIYGFEILEQNSFEQLCINYSSERLQQHFVLHTFKLEKALYAEEGISFSETMFKDNEPIVNLIDHNIDGIFSFIDDEIRLPMSSDDRLLGRMNAKHLQHKELYSRDIRNPKAFKVHHYTGPVAYRVANFLEKAKDEISWNILEMFGDSDHPVLKQIFKPSSKITPEEVKSMKQSLGVKCRLEMSELMTRVQKGEPYYIKCMLPNRDKLPMCFDHNIVKEQLRANGVLETLEICHKGFAVKMNIEEFVKKYKMLGRKVAPEKKDLNIQDIVAGIHNYDPTQLKVGKNIVFLKDDDLKLLDLQRKETVEQKARKIFGGNCVACNTDQF
eukprot:TRINITY_DN219_c0_g1_i3.p2 TRINITY_DN219_c0_g1~~TRINITY_DN219_c0_g1_i3.p2  ORF type:complete len:753 (-),score=99.86 TRINITY_DN219_c0_g1_i3:11185-13443(-)